MILKQDLEKKSLKSLYLANDYEMQQSASIPRKEEMVCHRVQGSE